VPLKILRRFKPESTWLLEPGDMLYLPPHVAHQGVAVGPGCMTWSVGFRAPNRIALADAAMAQHLDQLADADWSDPWLGPTDRPGEIPKPLMDALAKSVKNSMPSRASMERAIGRVLSEPAPQAVFSPPARADSLASFRSKASRRGLALAGASRLLYRGSQFFINGEMLDATASKTGAAFLRRLADHRRLDPQACAMALASAPELTTLRGMYLAGWIVYD
jgi:50S ribosomal protein L16 3-hydroxylase